MVTHRRILLHCAAAFCAGMVFGYDTVVNPASISMPGFLLYFGDVSNVGSLYLPSIWTSLWVAMSSFTQAIGGAGIGILSDRIGRKWCCVGVCAVSFAGVAVQYCAVTRGALLAGKMVNGLAIGCLTASSTAWASKISPVRLRGPIQSAIVLFTVLLQGIGLVLCRVYVTDLTESSFRHVKAEAARKTLERLYGPNNSIDARLATLSREIEQEAHETRNSGTGSYISAFQGSNRRRTLTVIWMFWGLGLNGAAFLAQNIYFLIIAGLEPVHKFDIGVGGFGLAALVIIGSWFYMEKMGRRSLWLIGCVGNCLCMIVIGALYYAPGSGPLWAIAILMNVLISWQLTTMLSTSWAITGEISSYRLRGKTQSIAVITYAFESWLFQFVVPYIYNTDAGNLGARTGFIFAGTSLVLAIRSFFLIPELTGFSTEEIDGCTRIRYLSDSFKTMRMAESETRCGIDL
ncbi:major facilitator superfamily domain-containing protein [Xylariales sp. PMI_506]|nr:major facilitator superfamily domain-containing protein [Xylariales sp. PMI_506]